MYGRRLIPTIKMKLSMNSLGISKVIPIVVGVVVVGAIIGVILLLSADPVGPTLPPASDLPEPEPALTFTLTGLNTRWNRNEVENPTLEVPLGSEVRIVLENDDPIPHNFAMVDFDIRTEILNEGDRLTVMFTADEAGRFAYFCPIHPGLMDGIIVVGP